MQFLKQFCFIILFVYFFSLTLFSQSTKVTATTRKYTPKQLQQDAELIKRVSLAMHPVIGIYNSRAYYSKLFDDFIFSLTDSLTEKQFRIKTKLIIDELHCGHTESLFSNAYYKEIAKQTNLFSPYLFIPIKEKLFVIASLDRKKDTLLKRGVEITKINGIAVDSMIRYCNRFITTDGFNQSGKEHYIQLGFNSVYLSLFGRPDTFHVDYLAGTTPKHLKYAAVKLKSIPILPISLKHDSNYVRYRLAKMSYRYLDNDNKTMHLKIEGFSRKRSSKAYRKLFKKLKTNSTENLVIDLRNNGGGSLENSYNLLSYLLDSAQTQTLRTPLKSYPYKKYTNHPVFFKLMRFGFSFIAKKKTINDTDNFVYTIKPRKKNHYAKNVYVLINGGSFSASCLVSAYLKATKRAVFIGEETSGTMEGCNAGITPYYTLPNTKIKIRMPAFRIVHDVCPKTTGRGIIPDFKIEYTLKDILTKKDLELLKVNELINKDLK